MALEMDPERRRKLLAIDEAQRAWAAKYGIDDYEWTEDRSADRPGRTPTQDQVAELRRTIRELCGQDPETGLYRD